MKIFFVLSSSLLLLSGCARSFHMTVDAYSSPEAVNKKAFCFITTEKSSKKEGLQEKEFQEMTRKTMLEVGFSEMPSDEANVGVMLDYGMTGPMISQQVYSSPLYGQTGIAETETKGKGHYCPITKSWSYSKSFSNTPEKGIIGYETKVDTIVNYVCHLSLIGYDMEKFRLNNKLEEIWRVYVTTTGQMDDLRRLFPFFLTGAKNYIGKSTWQKIDINLEETDPQVLKIKGITQ